ncbi:MAG TPA: glycosyltransferase family 2 protein [Anaeromyxobacter sp.]
MVPPSDPHDDAPSAPAFSVFTPTFNRAHTLARVRDSLRAQTFRDFEWVIVDDGSEDGTRALVAGWAAVAEFPIRYFWQPNAGKAAATNRGAQEARGELFLIADSDDAFVPHALERFWRHWRSIPPGARHRFSGVTALCCDERGELIGDPFPREPLDGSWWDIHYKYAVRGEKWGFHLTSVFREFPFPVDLGRSHVPEIVASSLAPEVVWRAMSRRYETRYVNEILRVYYRGADDQMTRLSPRVWARIRFWYAQRLYEDREWLTVAPLVLLKLAIHYARFSFLSGDPVRAQFASLRTTGLKLLWAAAAPVGLLLSLRDRARESRPSRGARRRSPRTSGEACRPASRSRATS